MAHEAPTASQHLSLFNRPEFHRLNLVEGRQALARFDHVVEGRLVGSLAGVVDGHELTSGYSAPFGGPDLVRGSETATAILTMLRDMLDQVAGDEITTVRIKAKPAFYGPAEEALQFALLNLGFSVESCELNYHLDLAGMESVDDYVRRLKPPARRALKHAADEPFTFRTAADDDEWRLGYGILDRNRRAKDRRLKLSFDYVRRVRDTFPGRIRMYLLAHDGRDVAAALVYKVKPTRDLVVYWGDADHELARSPMNVLVARLVEAALAEGTLSLDIGTSSVDGVPDQGLIQFKESVLARPRLRLDFVRHLPGGAA